MSLRLKFKEKKLQKINVINTYLLLVLIINFDTENGRVGSQE